MIRELKEHFLEVDTVEMANKVDMEIWSFVGIKSDRYAFKKRVRK